MIKPLCLNQDDALLLGRCTYASLILLFWPLKSPRWLSELGSDHFHPPIGPFALFDGYPPLGLVIAIDAATFLCFALWVAGWGRWMVGLALTLCLTTLSGFFYSAGKIDHDFVILLFPALVTLPRVSPKRALLFCLGVYFASSGLAKALGGWLDPNTQATLSWALMYFHTYGKTEMLLEWSLTTLPGWTWEIFDQLTVWFELLAPLAILPSFRRWVFLAVPLFHFGTVLFFGIDFSRLLVIYLPLTFLCAVESSKPDCATLPPRIRTGLIALCGVGLLLGFLHSWFRGDYWSLPFPVHPPGLLLFPLFEALLIWGTILRVRAGRKETPAATGP